jgi:hypothetical protein
VSAFSARRSTALHVIVVLASAASLPTLAICRALPALLIERFHAVARCTAQQPLNFGGFVAEPRAHASEFRCKPLQWCHGNVSIILHPELNYCDAVPRHVKANCYYQ